MLRHLACFIPLIYAAQAPAATPLAECSAVSTPARAALLELYTSEGCSSCPPADKWLGGIRTAGYTQDKVIPLAFHVDYWDYIGWKDRFAKAEYSARQRRAASTGFSNFVYTPQVLVNGADFRDWHKSKRFADAINSSQQSVARADLSLHLENAGSEMRLKSTAKVSRPQDRKNADVFIAIYENRLVSTVKAGENSGRKLEHDYVVRELHGPYQLEDKEVWQRELQLNPEWKNRDAGVAIFAQDRSSGEVLQALAMKLCS